MTFRSLLLTFLLVTFPNGQQVRAQTTDPATIDPTTGTFDPTNADLATVAPTSPSDNGTDDSASTPGGICFMVYQLAGTYQRHEPLPSSGL